MEINNLYFLLQMEMMMDKIPFTQAGLEVLKTELTKLKSIERPAVIKAIAEAREHGDLNENAEYHAAREPHSFATTPHRASATSSCTDGAVRAPRTASRAI